MPKPQRARIQSKSIVMERNDSISDTSRQTTMSRLSRDPYKSRAKSLTIPFNLSFSDLSSSNSKLSLTSSTSSFRVDFEELKSKMNVSGESLNLCKCMAKDFKRRLCHMEKRLKSLEKHQFQRLKESNYSAIIQKNKLLSNKTKEAVRKLQMCGTEEEMKDMAGRICKNYLHGSWKTVDPAKLQFSRISGGLSNFLYYVALPDHVSKLSYARDSSPESESDTRQSRGSLVRSTSFISDEPKKVLLRIYGQVHGERAMDAIVTESVIFTLLSERRLGPRLHGVFSGGRIEEFLTARPLLTKELGEPAYSMKIAEKMAAIHSMDVPLNKEPNWLWKTMAKWIKTVREERLSGSYVPKNDAESRMIKEIKNVDFEKEVEWLKKFIATVDSPSVFCHNDMQEGNILQYEDEAPTNTTEDESMYVQAYDGIDDKSKSKLMFEDANTSDSITSRISDSGEPRLVLIDFEYCAYNYRGFDIANHFQEWRYDYTNPEYPFYYDLVENSPTLEQKEIFIKEYLKHYHANVSSQSPDSQSQQLPHPPNIDDVNHLLAEVDAFEPASNFLWSLWSFVNATKSQIPFGYWEYGICRLETYKRLKQEVIKKDNYGLPQKRKICEVDI